MVKKIISYNVNGMRAAIKKGFLDWLADESPDILCVQETKMQQDQMNTSVFTEMGYQQYWFSAQKKGYSGVLMLSKTVPGNIKAGIGIDAYDAEGRYLEADFGDVTLICTYFPSGSSGDERQAVKMKWLHDFSQHITNLRKSKPNLIISGDLNICHKAIDINHPERHHKSSGFLPEERAWFDSFIELGFVDSFRKFNQEPEQYSWWSYRANARAKNLGWRIDYHLVSASMDERVKSASILPAVKHSDHCPVVIDVAFDN